MRILIQFIATILLAGLATASSGPLRIYTIDVEGGQSTLIVSPSGHSMLIDTGWAGFEGRDADRIVAATKAAGVQRIDYLVITHYHRDHVGGVAQLTERIPIKTFVDHGVNLEDSEQAKNLYADYQGVLARSKGKHLVVKPGDTIPLPGLDVTVLAAAGQVIGPSTGKAAPNGLCSLEPAAAEDRTENAASVGLIVRYGKFRMLDMGDVTKRKELELVCPENRIGQIDLLIVSHHGLSQSNSRAFVQGMRPRVAIMNNGAHTGGSPQAWQNLHDSPGLQDLWQLHYASDSDNAHNSDSSLIANDDKTDGNYLSVVADKDGSFTVTNSRNGVEKRYGH
jgi:beta-lactamase superfamily II metal-dependent hydrolase